jgi:hypothetical protein
VPLFEQRADGEMIRLRINGHKPEELRVAHLGIEIESMGADAPSDCSCPGFVERCGLGSQAATGVLVRYDCSK